MLKKYDVLLLNDLNLFFGYFDLALSSRLKTSAGLKVLIWLRLALQAASVLVLIYCLRHVEPGTYPAAEFGAAVGLLAAVFVFLIIRRKFKSVLKRMELEKVDVEKLLGYLGSYETVYVCGYVLPVANFVGLGNLLQLDPSTDVQQFVIYVAEMSVKVVGIVILALYFMYYKVYAEAWHCYKRETDITEYRFGYCPSYTHDGNYLAPGNIICREPNKHRPCYGDRHADNIPRNWISPGRWTYGIILLIAHLSVVSAVVGIKQARGLFS